VSYGFLNLWALTDPYLSKRGELASEARHRFLRAIGLNRACYDAYYYLAILDALEKDWESALANLKEYIRSRNDDSYYYLLLGYIYARGKVKTLEEAQKAFRLARERASDPVSVKWAIKQLKGKQRPKGAPLIKVLPPPRKEYFPRSVTMNIDVPSFVDKTGHEEIKKLPELLSTRIREAIFRNNRFTLVEKRDSQEGGMGPLEIDSLLLGSIINADLVERTLLCNIKLVYPEGGNILFSRQIQVPYRDRPILAIADREANRIVGEIENSFVRTEGQVIQVSKNRVTVSLGSQNGIRPGYRALVLQKTSRMVVPPTKERLTSEIYLGEVLFEQIEENTSKARILNSGRVTIEAGDLVRTK
jgi:hypothetical protein